MSEEDGRWIMRSVFHHPGGYNGGTRNAQEPAMEQKAPEIRADDINPRFNWGRALPGLGIMGVDFEERVDYRRLHRYRLARGKQALGKTDLRALLVFQLH